jgi:salicylate hydroxylase
MTAAKPTHAPLDIKIIGAGIAGLSASIACAQAGHRVEVLERAGELAEVGAGFQITPNASKCLKGFGVLDRLVPYAAVATVFLVRRWSDGHVLARTDDFDADMMRRYDAPFLGLHRVDVQRILAGRAEELGVRIRFGAMVEEIDLHRSGVVLKTGERLDADLMVGADGLWSKSRQSFLTAQDLPEDAPLPTGDLAYRIVLDIQDVEDEEIRGLITNPSCQFWIGPGAHVVLYSIRSGTVANIVLLVPDNLPPDVARQPGDVEEMRAIFNDWDPVLLRFLNHVKKVDKWKLMHRPELQSWISPEANFVFVGDACHPMLP